TSCYVLSICTAVAAHCDILTCPTRRSSDLLGTYDKSARGIHCCANDLVAWTLADGKGFPSEHGLIKRTAAFFNDSVNRYFLARRSEEHTSELQSRENLVCRLLLEKKKLL